MFITRDGRQRTRLFRRPQMIWYGTKYSIAPNTHQGVLREKARYIVSHLTRALKRTDNSTFKGRAMLVTRSRKHILWYKKLIEEQVALLPIDEVCSRLGEFNLYQLSFSALMLLPLLAILPMRAGHMQSQMST